MVNPINPSPSVFPVDQMPAELPPAMARPAIQVSASAQAHDAGTATTGNPGQSVVHGNTPLEQTLEQINKSMQAWSTGMRFEVDEDAQRVVVSIIDSESGEVLRTVPSDAVLRVAKMIVQLQGGTVNVRA